MAGSIASLWINPAVPIGGVTVHSIVASTGASSPLRISIAVWPSVSLSGVASSRASPTSIREPSSSGTATRLLRLATRTAPDGNSSTRKWSLDTYGSLSSTNRGVPGRGSRPNSNGPESWTSCCDWFLLDTKNCNMRSPPLAADRRRARSSPVRFGGL